MRKIVLNTEKHNHNTCHKSGPVIIYSGDVPVIDYDASKMIVKNYYKLKKVINISLEYADGSIKTKDMVLGNIETILYLKDGKLIEVTGKIVDIRTKLVRDIDYENKAYIILDASKEYSTDIHTIEISLIRDFYVEFSEDEDNPDQNLDTDIPDVINPINPDGTLSDKDEDSDNSNTEDDSNKEDSSNIEDNKSDTIESDVSENEAGE